MGTELSTIPKVRNVFSCTFATLPGTAGEGDMAYCTDTYLLYRWSGAAWVAITSVAAFGIGAPLTFADHRLALSLTGTATAETGQAFWLYALPFVVPRPITLASIDFKITTASAGKYCRAGLYTNSADQPDALIIDSGLIEMTVGAKNFVCTSALTAGIVYWFVYSKEDGIGKLAAVDHDAAIMNDVDLAAAPFESLTRWAVARGAWAALPTPFTAGGSWTAGNNPVARLNY